MERVVIRSGWFVAAVLVLLTFVESAPPAVAAAPKQKLYYLTTTLVASDAALSACARGYHMATLWEIRDTTSLTYDSSRGVTRADSGFGPAAELFGWIRTGGASSAINTPGVANCSAWTSTASTDYGTMVELNGHWSDPAAVASPWNAATQFCSNLLRVWCVEN